MMVLTAEAPGLVHCACERYLQQALHSVRLSAALGAAGIWIEECLTDMISPAAFAALNLPYVQRLVEAIRALGLRSIYYFCGNPAGKWPQILATGADAFSFEESKKGFTLDLEDIAERVGGRGVVLGNLDAIGVLQNGSEERLHAEIRRQLDCGRRHGRHFIMSLGSPVTPETRVSRVRLYCDLVRELA
jgi:uroporphyrinogen-III decarboxylase